MKADALIIGGGLMGSSTALHLARRGVRSLVLEKDSPGRHASGVNAGGLRRLNRHPAEIPLSVAAAEAALGLALVIRLYRQRETIHLDDVSELRG